MAEKTEISWTDATWSPWEGCTKVGPGCDHCYAESMNNWLRKGENWGPGAPRRAYSDAHWQKPLKWNAAAEAKGERLSVFPSVCDPFDNEVGKGRRQDFFRLIRATPWIDWLLLTKRIGNADQMIEEAIADMEIDDDPAYTPWPWPNVRLGATVVNQDEYDRDIGKLLRTPAYVHFLSIEPMLGPIDMRLGGASMPDYSEHRPLPRLDWVIDGAESGPHARPAHLDWFQSLRDQCSAAGVAYHHKQNGEWVQGEIDPSSGEGHALFHVDDSYGIELAERGYKTTRAHGVDFAWVGKKVAGWLLDGVEHKAFPRSKA